MPIDVADGQFDDGKPRVEDHIIGRINRRHHAPACSDKLPLDENVNWIDNALGLRLSHLHGPSTILQAMFGHAVRAAPDLCRCRAARRQ
jgi:hypothetical protein